MLAVPESGKRENLHRKPSLEMGEHLWTEGGLLSAGKGAYAPRGKALIEIIRKKLKNLKKN